MIDAPLVIATAASLAGRAALQAAARSALEKGVVAPLKDRKGKQQALKRAQEALERAIDQQLESAYRWATQFKPHGTAEPLSTIEASLGLLHSRPKHTRDPRCAPEGHTEVKLLRPGQHTLLLGGAGAGKTTTVRRLICDMVDPSADTSVVGFLPLLVVAREHDWSDTRLPVLLSKLLGLQPDEGREVQAVAAALAEAKAVLFVDGLDEVSPAGARRQLHRDLQVLARAFAGQSTIVATSRPGEHPHLDEFHSYELLKLSPAQVHGIAHRRLNEQAATFVQTLQASPLRDTGRRPLFLQHLITVYMREGSLPKRPSMLYRSLTRLLLSEWDRDRDITRLSRYAGFDTEEKMTFLSDLAYQLTIERRIRFSSTDLEAAYGSIHSAYDLPERDAAQVAREIESHNGLIVQAGVDFEFSHLSLQEYLCADYLSRSHDPQLLREYIDVYPGPVAVAVALAADPSDWLSGMVLRRGRFNDRHAVRSFVARLGDERPAFKISADLGRSLLFLMSKVSGEDAWAFDGLSQQANAGRSVATALQEYEVGPGNRGVRLTYKDVKPAGRRYIPDPMGIDQRVWEHFRHALGDSAFA